MFKNDLLSDVSLLVRGSNDEGASKKKKIAIPAHKFVLSICSPVFFAMFYGEMAEKSDSIDLPDCEYEGVREMLRYMYSGKVGLNQRNVVQVLYVANKYMVQSLSDVCVRFLRKYLDPENVFCVLSHAEQYDEKVLMDQCWEVIDRETEEAVKSEEFANIERSLLERIVKRESLTIREIELFKAVDRWATKECERQGLAADGNMKRRILGEKIVTEIRFPVMEEKEFASVVLDIDMLTSKELVNMMKHFNSVLTSPIGFHGQKRAGAFQSCFRFRNVLRSGRSLVTALNRKKYEQCFNFCVDKDIMLHGIRLFGSDKNREYKVTLTLSCGTVKNVTKSGKFRSATAYRKDQSYYGVDIMLDPVRLIQGVTYNVKAVLNGPFLSYGFTEAEEVKTHGVTFSFSNCSRSETDCKECGQFGEIFFKLP